MIEHLRWLRFLQLGMLVYISWIFIGSSLAADPENPKLAIERDGHWLVIKGDHLPEKEIRINYLEAYCRAGSTDADWVKHTVIPHKSKLVSINDEGTEMKILDTLEDGVTVEHLITVGENEVTFDLKAHNPSDVASEAHWAQPCVRLGAFTGFNADHSNGDIEDYLGKCFVFNDGKLTRMPTPVWTLKARYIPGQVWSAPGVPQTDVNPRPLNPSKTSNGLIGCFSGDNSLIFATAWEPYQELFQGVARCLHSDFRIGGLKSGETKTIRGKVYLVSNGEEDLLKRYQADFPGHLEKSPDIPKK